MPISLDLRAGCRASAIATVAAGLALAGLTAVGGPSCCRYRPGNDNIAGATPPDGQRLRHRLDRRGHLATHRGPRFRRPRPHGLVQVHAERRSERASSRPGPWATTWTRSSRSSRVLPVRPTFAELSQLDYNDDGAGLLSYLPADVTAGTTYFLPGGHLRRDRAAGQLRRAGDPPRCRPSDRRPNDNLAPTRPGCSKGSARPSTCVWRPPKRPSPSRPPAPTPSATRPGTTTRPTSPALSTSRPRARRTPSSTSTAVPSVPTAAQLHGRGLRPTMPPVTPA